MSLAMIGKAASYEFRWRHWALLRDVVVTHFERGRAGTQYPLFASIGRVLGVGSLRIDAAALAGELRAIRAGLATRPIGDLVLGPLTAGVLYPTLNLETARPLTRVELSHVVPIGREKTLDEYFSSMIESMLEVSRQPTVAGTVEVRDG